MHSDVTSMIFAYCSKRNFSTKKQDSELLYERSYQPILRYLYTEVTKCRGEISLDAPLHSNYSFNNRRHALHDADRTIINKKMKVKYFKQSRNHQ